MQARRRGYVDNDYIVLWCARHIARVLAWAVLVRTQALTSWTYAPVVVAEFTLLLTNDSSYIIESIGPDTS